MPQVACGARVQRHQCALLGAGGDLVVRRPARAHRRECRSAAGYPVDRPQRCTQRGRSERQQPWLAPARMRGHCASQRAQARAKPATVSGHGGRAAGRQPSMLGRAAAQLQAPCAGPVALTGYNQLRARRLGMFGTHACISWGIGTGWQDTTRTHAMAAQIGANFQLFFCSKWARVLTPRAAAAGASHFRRCLWGRPACSLGRLRGLAQLERAREAMEPGHAGAAPAAAAHSVALATSRALARLHSQL